MVIPVRLRESAVPALPVRPLHQGLRRGPGPEVNHRRVALEVVILATGVVANACYNYWPATQDVIDATARIEEICKREKISEETFNCWSNELLINDNLTEDVDVVEQGIDPLQEQRFNLVNEGSSGLTSVAEICRREKIDHETFLSWSQEFLKLKKERVFNLLENRSLYTRNKLLVKNNSCIEAFKYAS